MLSGANSNSKDSTTKSNWKRGEFCWERMKAWTARVSYSHWENWPTLGLLLPCAWRTKVYSRSCCVPHEARKATVMTLAIQTKKLRLWLRKWLICSRPHSYLRATWYNEENLGLWITELSLCPGSQTPHSWMTLTALGLVSDFVK